MRRSLLTAVLVPSLALSLLAGVGCQKFDGPQPKKDPATAGATAAKKAEAAVKKAEEKKKKEEEKAKPPTFAEEAAAALKAIDKGVDECVGEYVSKMDMKKIEDGFLPVNVNQMDRACREPVELYKTRGRKLIGKHAALDGHLWHAAALGDAYLRMSFRLKQLGARERWKVIKAIEAHRAEVMDHAAGIKQGAADVAAWAADTKEQTGVETQQVDDGAYAARARELVRWISERLPKLADDYDQFAYKPADIQESIYFFSFRYAFATTKRWYDVAVARFGALQCTGARCEKTRKKVDTLLEAAQKVFDRYEKGLSFYRGDYFARLDKAVPLQKKLRDEVKAFLKLAKKTRL